MRGKALPIFEENGVDESEIIFSDISDMNPPDGKMPKLAKIMASCKDERIREYEWVLISDADVFMCKGLQEGPKRFPFFRKLIEYDKEATFPMTSKRSDFTISDVFNGKADNLFSSVFTDDYSTKEKRKLWLEDVESITSPEFMGSWEEGIDFQVPHASLRIVPLRHFAENRTEELGWIYKATQLLRNEEAAFGIYSVLFSRPLQEFSKDFGVPYELLYQRKQYRTQNIYFSHPIRQENEFYWRKSIGAL